MKQLTINADHGLGLSAALFESETAKALVQIIHGSVEHKERYYEFAQFLCEQGYTVMQGVQQLKEAKQYQFKNSDLHILSISGEGDPVTGGTAGLRESFRLLRRVGYHNFEQD